MTDRYIFIDVDAATRKAFELARNVIGGAGMYYDYQNEEIVVIQSKDGVILQDEKTPLIISVFDRDDMDRIKKQVESNLKYLKKNPKAFDRIKYY